MICTKEHNNAILRLFVVVFVFVFSWLGVRELRYVFCFVVHVALKREYLLVKGFELSF